MKNKFLISLLLINSFFFLKGEVQQISQCGNGKATYYATNENGACGFGDITGTIDTAAAEMPIYDGSNGCGICYEVIGEKGTKIVMIADACPGCTHVTQTGKIHLDLDERIFPDIDEKDKGVIDTSMRMVPCSVNGNVILHITETNNYYFNAYVSNYKIGVKSLEISTNGGNYVNVKRETWNRFVTNLNGNINNIKIKITSISGEEIICADLSGVIQGDYDCGKQFSTDKFFDLYSKKVIEPNYKSECCKKPSLIENHDSCKVDTSYTGDNNNQGDNNNNNNNQGDNTNNNSGDNNNQGDNTNNNSGDNNNQGDNTNNNSGDNKINDDKDNNNSNYLNMILVCFIFIIYLF